MKHKPSGDFAGYWHSPATGSGELFEKRAELAGLIVQGRETGAPASG